MLFKLFLVCFAVVALYRTRTQYLKRAVSKYWFAVWSLLWLAVIGVALAPQTTDFVANVVGVERGADLLVYTAVIVLSYAVYRQMLQQRKLHEELTELVRAIAIERAQHPESADRT